MDSKQAYAVNIILRVNAQKNRTIQTENDGIAENRPFGPLVRLCSFIAKTNLKATFSFCHKLKDLVLFRA